MLSRLLRFLPARLLPSPRVLRVLAWVLALSWFSFAALFLTLRYAVLPHVPEYRAELEHALSAAFKLPVSIAKLDAEWHGLRPRLSMHGFVVKDKEGREALKLDEVDAVPAWSSLWHAELRLHRLEVHAPTLEIRRDTSGVFYVAGIKIDPNSQDTGASEWLLQQDALVVRDATVTWYDELRAAPPLQLAKLNFTLRNSGSRHRFGFTALPPRNLADKLDIRGDFRGSSQHLAAWQGELYAALDYADLAVWRTWVDYPIELPRGSGGLHLWLKIAEQRLKSVSADVRLDDVQVRLARKLPMLDLKHLAGRIGYAVSGEGNEINLQQLVLRTQNDISITPTDANVRWKLDAKEALQQGELNVSSIDLTTLGQLSAYLPMDDAIRAKLAAAAARGQVQELKLSWHDSGTDNFGFKLKGRFAALGAAAQGIIPGFTGLSGEVEGNEKSGRVVLTGRNTVLDLPRVFSESKLPLTSLDARLKWQRTGDDLQFNIEQANFHNADTTGSVSGYYRSKPVGLGEIDLDARLKNTRGHAVWRYMPLVVNKMTRDWLQAGIGGGIVDEARLTLKGELDKFPFNDGSGVFQVKGHFREASLLPAKGWPQLQNIEGDLNFTGARMLITGKSANIYGAQLANVTAEIPDLDNADPQLLISGTASGPTQEFLKYLETSPISERISHVTAGMQAGGNGALQLKLTMPLQHSIDTHVEGSYQFNNNRLTVLPSLPPLTEMNGKLEFTENGMAAKDARANLLGAPLTAQVSTDHDGVLRISGEGGLTAAALRKQFALPLLDNIAGSARWKGLITVKKRDLGMLFESDLLGVSSSLPEPFNKSAPNAMALRFERRPFSAQVQRRKGRKTEVASGASYDMNEISLGKSVKVQLVQRAGAPSVGIERGIIALGVVPRKLPEKGVLLAVDQPNLNLDAWRTLNAKAGNGGNGNGVSSNASPFFITELNLHAGEVNAFGRTVHDATLVGHLVGKTWTTRLKSREITAGLDWTGGVGDAPGHLVGHLSQFTIPNETTDKTSKIQHVSGDALRQMPSLTLVVDSLKRDGRDLGSLKLDADTRDNIWNAQFSLSNDDGSLTGSGRWNPDPAQANTKLDFQVKAKSVEKLLNRVGYADAIRRGSASIKGTLAWNGAPYAPHYPSLNGSVKLDVKDGQFNKLEPGFGRLLGVLSLQSLPRRITLDFNDVFSQGFAFDRIEGQAQITRGVMQTEELQIIGPAAKVRMNGKVDLVQETQDLTVRVQPALGNSLATGVFLLHPATGAIAWAAQKLLKDPVDQVFAFSYAITGSWDDPQVNKLGAVKPDVTKTP